ncbi:MAG: recombination protein RecR [Candidatus Aureabacteria bacterium]|nr:recombination protein RecR [Candidatus Auribacterota bacterium]
MSLQALERLTNWIAALPGMGIKSASRAAYYLLDLPEERIRDFTEALLHARSLIRKCPVCGCYWEGKTCQSCCIPYSKEGILCVVETAQDVFILKKYLPNGTRFHVLGGKLSPLQGIAPSDLNIEPLENRLKEKELKEMLIALGSDVESETTSNYLLTRFKETGIKISRLAFGLQVGASLSATDERSIQKSLSGRVFY